MLAGNCPIQLDGCVYIGTVGFTSSVLRPLVRCNSVLCCVGVLDELQIIRPIKDEKRKEIHNPKNRK